MIKTQINNITLDKAIPKIEQNLDKQKLKEQTDQFESILLKQLLDISLKNENSLFGKDPGSKIYNSMYNSAVSDQLSGGFGFSKLLFDFLIQKA